MVVSKRWIPDEIFSEGWQPPFLSSNWCFDPYKFPSSLRKSFGKSTRTIVNSFHRLSEWRTDSDLWCTFTQGMFDKNMYHVSSKECTLEYGDCPRH